MSWHNFESGQTYNLNEVVAVCEERLRTDKVTDIAGKHALVAKIESNAPSEIVWSPFSTGWGASPFNPSCWKSTTGSAILPDSVEISNLSADDD